MATNRTSEARTDRGRSARGGSPLRKTVASAMTTETLLDLAQKLGVFDIFIDRVRGRLQEVDIDDFLDDAVDYLKRNPEVIVVLLATITVAAGAIVYLDRRNEERDWSWGRDRDEEEVEVPVRSAPRPAAASPRRRVS